MGKVKTAEKISAVLFVFNMIRLLKYRARTGTG